MLKIISWNICGLPKKINFFHNPNKKINLVIDKLLQLNSDVICLQEVFDYGLRKKIIDKLEENSYNIHFNDSGKCKSMMSSNGLLTASKYNIIGTDLLNYTTGSGYDFFIKKGILTVSIYHPILKEIEIHNTHMQSDVFPFCCIGRWSRKKQFIEAVDYMDLSKNSIFLGDLNDDFSSTRLNNFRIKSCMVSNDYRIPTFPSLNNQYDYIFTNIPKIERKYYEIDVVSELLSDHNIMMIKIDRIS